MTAVKRQPRTITVPRPRTEQRMAAQERRQEASEKKADNDEFICPAPGEDGSAEIISEKWQRIGLTVILLIIVALWIARAGGWLQ